MLVERKFFLACLLAADGVGNKTVGRILRFAQAKNIPLDQLFDDPSTLLSPQIINQNQFDAIQFFKKQFLAADFKHYLEAKQVEVISFEDDNYPQLLKQSEGFPLILYYQGKKIFHANLENSIAVVGTRKITSYGQLVTKKITSELVDEKMVIISGGMYGVDMLAHQTALAKAGQTIAVLGYGFDHSYPSQIKNFLVEFINQGGMLVSEYPPFKPALPSNFPARNRIVAGLSQAVVVTEAASKSGSHITAQFCLDNGRSVYAVPGPITNPYSEGTKWLINQGASLISSGYEVVADLKPCFKVDQLEFPKGENAVQEQIIKLVAAQSISSDEIARQLNITITDISTELTFLEIDQILEKKGETWQLKKF